MSSKQQTIETQLEQIQLKFIFFCFWPQECQWWDLRIGSYLKMNIYYIKYKYIYKIINNITVQYFRLSLIAQFQYL